MRAFTFHVAMHEEYGSLGLRPKWYPTGDPLGGMAAAHDILEHFPNDDGSTEGELMALGASLFVRGDGGWSNKYRHYDEVRDPAGDFPNIWGYHIDRENGRDLRVSPRTRDGSAKERAHSIVTYAKQEMREHYERSGPTREDYAQMEGWLAYGYVRAQCRYSRVIGGARALASTFMEIEHKCEQALKHAESGMALTVYVNVQRSLVRVVCDYQGDSFA